MLKALIGRKLNMSQLWDSHGRATPVTTLLVEPNVVVNIREKEKDGYEAVQVGQGSRKKPNKVQSGILKKANLKIVPKILKEVDFDGEIKLGQEVQVDEVFRKGAMVDVIGTSKGRGFAGVVKRYGFHGGPKTHGQSDRHRAPGSIGSGTTPGRVQKGLKMAGHMGNAHVTVLGLEVMEVDKEERTLTLKGSVPGFSGAELLIKKSKKKKSAYHEPEIQALPNLGGDEEKTEGEAPSEGQVPAPETQAEVKQETGGEGPTQ